jgi:predicted DNA-binding transcriptional regulator AlpA
MSQASLDLKEAAEYCGISHGGLIRLLCRREFPRPTIRNSKAYFWQDELDEWLTEDHVLVSKPASKSQVKRVSAQMAANVRAPRVLGVA